jgi:hypothetical protein
MPGTLIVIGLALVQSFVQVQIIEITGECRRLSSRRDGDIGGTDEGHWKIRVDRREARI